MAKKKVKKKDIILMVEKLQKEFQDLEKIIAKFEISDFEHIKNQVNIYDDIYNDIKDCYFNNFKFMPNSLIRAFLASLLAIFLTPSYAILGIILVAYAIIENVIASKERLPLKEFMTMIEEFNPEYLEQEVHKRIEVLALDTQIKKTEIMVNNENKEAIIYGKKVSIMMNSNPDFLGKDDFEVAHEYLNAYLEDGFMPEMSVKTKVCLIKILQDSLQTEESDYETLLTLALLNKALEQNKTLNLKK